MCRSATHDARFSRFTRARPTEPASNILWARRPIDQGNPRMPCGPNCGTRRVGRRAAARRRECHGARSRSGLAERDRFAEEAGKVLVTWPAWSGWQSLPL